MSDGIWPKVTRRVERIKHEHEKHASEGKVLGGALIHSRVVYRLNGKVTVLVRKSEEGQPKLIKRIRTEFKNVNSITVAFP